jgi:hypothetical protein
MLGMCMSTTHTAYVVSRMRSSASQPLCANVTSNCRNVRLCAASTVGSSSTTSTASIEPGVLSFSALGEGAV